MKILVTGASGFVGSHLVRELVQRKHEVIAVGRSQLKAQAHDWFNDVTFSEWDAEEGSQKLTDRVGPCDVVAHLAWSGLPNYKDLSHLRVNLPASMDFVQSQVEAGCRRILVTGTCLEYGMKNGCLSETMETNPTTAYGIAKDSLRRFVQLLQQSQPFELIWTRLFYMYGPGQNPKSLLSQLELAATSGAAEFPMSAGEQLRDYLPISKVAGNLADLIDQPGDHGIVNVCSGQPLSVRRLVEQWLKAQHLDIRLALGRYPYPEYEPMAFWGDDLKLRNILSSANCESTQ